MESIKHSIEELSQHFTNTMAEFQQNLSSSIPATSPTSHLAAQFSAFRSFVMTALEGLQLQIQLLANQYDQFEMRSRRKILLVHGVTEDKKEEAASAVVKVLSEHLKIPDLSVEDASRCHRLGTPSSEKPRPILIKFRDTSLKYQIWYSKTSLKNTGITLSEFLTKPRHEAFMAARQRFGVSKCWTRDGYIFVIGADGKRHKITTCSDLNKISNSPEAKEQAATVGQASVSRSKPVLTSRSKRVIKK